MLCKVCLIKSSKYSHSLLFHNKSFDHTFDTSIFINPFKYHSKPHKSIIHYQFSCRIIFKTSSQVNSFSITKIHYKNDLCKRSKTILHYASSPKMLKDTECLNTIDNEEVSNLSVEIYQEIDDSSEKFKCIVTGCISSIKSGAICCPFSDEHFIWNEWVPIYFLRNNWII